MRRSILDEDMLCSPQKTCQVSPDISRIEEAWQICIYPGGFETLGNQGWGQMACSLAGIQLTVMATRGREWAPLCPPLCFAFLFCPFFGFLSKLGAPWSGGRQC